MAHKVSRFGWLPDLPDQRDLVYAAPRPPKKKLPTKADLRNGCPSVYDQGQLGSCTANAIGAAFEFGLLKQNKSSDFMPSRLFIYYNERVIEHSIDSDNGAMIRDGIKSVNNKACVRRNTGLTSSTALRRNLHLLVTQKPSTTRSCPTAAFHATSFR